MFQFEGGAYGIGLRKESRRGSVVKHQFDEGSGGIAEVGILVVLRDVDQGSADVASEEFSDIGVFDVAGFHGLMISPPLPTASRQALIAAWAKAASIWSPCTKTTHVISGAL
jgi:hypothetical protein